MDEFLEVKLLNFPYTLPSHLVEKYYQFMFSVVHWNIIKISCLFNIDLHYYIVLYWFTLLYMILQTSLTSLHIYITTRKRNVHWETRQKRNCCQREQQMRCPDRKCRLWIGRIESFSVGIRVSDRDVWVWYWEQVAWS